MKRLVLDIESRTVRTESGCLEWQGATRRGYAAIRRHGRTWQVHRLVCAETHGPPPEGRPWALHRCDNKVCVESTHLYWGSAKDNHDDRVKAGTATGGRPWVTHCPQNHEYTPENAYRDAKGRSCKECRREAVRRYRARQMGVAS